MRTVLITYLIVINLISFLLMGIDKRRAIKNKWRISEKTLFLTAFLFGSVGAIAGIDSLLFSILEVKHKWQ